MVQGKLITHIARVKHRKQLHQARLDVSERLVSIIVPAYNAERFIKKTLNSLLKQSHQTLEIIVVDDVSTDNTLTILQEYKALDERISIIRSDVHRGPGGARNLGLNASNGEYVLFFDADDHLHRRAIERLLKIAVWKNSEITAGVIRRQKKNKLFYKNMPRLWRFNMDMKTKPIDYAHYVTNLAVWNKLFSKVFLIRNKLVFLEKCLFEDADFWARAVLFAQRITYCPFVVTTYHYNPHSFSRQKRDLHEVLKVLERVFQETAKTYNDHQAREYERLYVYAMFQPLVFIVARVFKMRSLNDRDSVLQEVQAFLNGISNEHLMSYYIEKNKRQALILTAIKQGQFSKAQKLYRRFYRLCTVYRIGRGLKPRSRMTLDAYMNQ